MTPEEELLSKYSLDQQKQIDNAYQLIKNHRELIEDLEKANRNIEESVKITRDMLRKISNNIHKRLEKLEQDVHIKVTP